MSILQMSIQGSMLIIAVVIVRAIALNKLPKMTFLFLWAVVLCRLLIPFSIPSPYSLATLLSRMDMSTPETVQQPVVRTDYSVAPLAGVQVVETGIVPATPPTVQSPMPSLGIDPGLAVWLLGMLIVLTCFIVSHIRSARLLCFALPLKDHPNITHWLSANSRGHKITILYSDQTLTPITVGVLRPRIILPKTIDMNDAKLMSYVLTHEFCHIKRLDMVWKMLMVAGVCVHWFNPLVWVMLILMNRDLELTCDEMVVRHLGATNKKEYAFSLINLAEQRNKFSPLYNSFSKNAIEERITAVMKIKKRSAFSVCIACLLILSITSVLATSEVIVNVDSQMENETNTAIEASTDIPIGYTQEELDAVLSLKIENYEEMSVTAFNEYISNALFNNRYISECHDKISTQMFMGGSQHDFVVTTMMLSITELAAAINNETPYYIYHCFRNEVADGNQNNRSYLLVPCDIQYTIEDANVFTVGMRDQAFIEYRGLLQQEIDRIPATDYGSIDIQRQLTDAFVRITQSINQKYNGIQFNIQIREVMYKESAPSGSVGRIEIMTREQMDREHNAVPVTQPQSVMSMPDPTTGKTIYTFDNGVTWLSEEEYLKTIPEEIPIEYWTYDEYEQWLKDERAFVQNMVGERVYNPSMGWYVWTQETVDQLLAQNEEILIEIGKGLQVAKDWSSARYTDYAAITAGTGTFEYSFAVTLKNGQIARIGSFETHEELSEAVIAYCQEQISAGNLTQEDYMAVLEELQNLRRNTSVHYNPLLSSSYDGNPFEYSQDYSEYAPFGLQMQNGILYFEETPIRIFVDRYTFEGNDYSRNEYFSKDGIIDVRAIRDSGIQALNPSGTIDPAGAVVKLEIIEVDPSQP